MSRRIATIISYCTNDYRFIDRCIAEAMKFSDEVVVCVCDHFFDGSPENRSLLEHTYAQNPGCRFIEFTYLPDRLYSLYHPMTPEDPDWSALWAATSRYVGLHYIESDWVLFLDSDEIVEGEPFRDWFNQQCSLSDCLRLAAYLYAVRPTLRCKKVVNLPLLVNKETLAPLTLLGPLERIGAYLSHPGPKEEKIVGLQGRPLVHHYSWVRTKEEALQKGATWSHRHDRDWVSVIDEAYGEKPKEKPGHLFDPPMEMEEIDAPYFDPLQVQIPTVAVLNRKFLNVAKVNDRDVFLKGLEFL